MLAKRGAGPTLLRIATAHCFPDLMTMRPALPGEGGNRSIWSLVAVHNRNICLVVATDLSFCKAMNPEIALHGSMML